VGNSLSRPPQQYGPPSAPPISTTTDRLGEPHGGTEFDYDFNHRRRNAAQGWQTITKPFNSTSFTGPAFGRDPGDGVQTWPHNQIQLGKCLRLAGRLNVEVDYVKVNSAGDPPRRIPVRKPTLLARVAPLASTPSAKPTCM